MEKAPLVRSPLFVFRLVVGLVLTTLGVQLLVVFENALLGLRRDITTLQASFPEYVPVAIEIIVGVAIAVTILATNVGLLVRKRVRRWLLVNAAAIIAAILSALGAELVVQLATSDALIRAVENSGPEASLGNEGLASLIAVLTLASPWISRRLHPWATGIVVAGVSLSFVGGALAVITLPLDIGIGMVAGSLVALIFKTRDRTPTPEEISATLGDSGFKLARVDRAAVDARGSVPWFATTTDGAELFVKTLNSDHRAADLLFRLYRWIRLRKAGDRRPFTSLERAVEHEALLSLAARSRGIRTPQLVTIAEIGTDAMLLAYERIDGHSLDEVDPETITPEMLRDLWRLVADLDQAGIAHRDLRLANVFAADDGTPWLIDFGFAELAAPSSLRARDVAELIGSTAVVIGAERAAETAIEVLGPEHVSEALPWIQPLALSSATRTGLGKAKDFERLREVVAVAIGVKDVSFVRLERVSARTLVLLASFALTAYFLVPQFAEASGFFDDIRNASIGWVAVAAIASVLSYVGAGIGIVGAVPVRLELGPVIAAQVAGSFANRITPAKVGGMATNVRFLQRCSISPATAVSAVGLNTLAGFAVHVSLLLLLGVIAGTSDDVEFPLPSGGATVVSVLIFILLSGLLVAFPFGRKLLTQNLIPGLASAWKTVSLVARTPTKLMALFFGSALVTVTYTVAMLASLYALGSHLPVITASFVYLGGAAVASAAPTPGGVGATEAALIAGYTAVGVDASLAFAAVLLFRLVTFWLPILPGWLALVVLQRRGDL
ncbi:MAG TPA: lysylphosphatidylglycerol synthase transmembrane domain-containing protein [Acidimicrobiia bacterium]